MGGEAGRLKTQRVFIRTFSVQSKIGGDGSVLKKVKVSESLTGRDLDPERDAPGTVCGETRRPLSGKCGALVWDVCEKVGAFGYPALPWIVRRRRSRGLWWL